MNIIFYFLMTILFSLHVRSLDETTASPSTTTECQIMCTHPYCPRGFTVESDPANCGCLKLVQCPQLRCAPGYYDSWSGRHCDCPQCSPCPTTCSTISNCPADKIRINSCGCEQCDEIIHWD